MSLVRSSNGAGGSAPATTRGSGPVESGTFVDKSVQMGKGGSARASASAPVSPSGTIVTTGSGGSASIGGELPLFLTHPLEGSRSVSGAGVLEVERGFMQSCGLGKMCAGLMLCMVSAPLAAFYISPDRFGYSDDIYPLFGLAGLILFGCVCLTGLCCILGRKTYECVKPALSSCV